MSQLWWQMPGPRRFVEQAAQDLRDGMNVVFFLPEHGPGGLKRALQDQFGDNVWLWETIDGRNLGKSTPVNVLIERYLPDLDATVPHNANTLVRYTNCGGLLLWIENLDGTSWPQWYAFLREFAHASRQRSQYERMLIVVPVVGVPQPGQPVDDACLRQHIWRGCVDALDMLLYAANLIADRRLSGHHKQIASAVVASIAAWDGTVAEALAGEELATIIQPDALLLSIAHERGWDSFSGADVTWERGMVDRTGESRAVMHAALLALHDPMKELDRRIWSGQVATLLPYIEERRRQILNEVRPLLRMPIKFPDGQVIHEIFDLEIGQIYRQVSQNGLRISPTTRTELYRLTEMRNRLAHLQLLQPEDIGT